MKKLYNSLPNWLKVGLCFIVVIFIGGITSKNSILRKKAARSKAKAEKTKYKARLERDKGAVISLKTQIKIANKKKNKNKSEVKILSTTQKYLEEKINKSLKKIIKTTSDIVTLDSAIAYAEKLKRDKK